MMQLLLTSFPGGSDWLLVLVCFLAVITLVSRLIIGPNNNKSGNGPESPQKNGEDESKKKKYLL